MESCMRDEKTDLSFREKIVSACNIPKDAALGYPITTLIGQNEIRVENYRGILEYADDKIRILTKIGQIQILGKGLEIPYYTNDEMKITGRIKMIECL